MSDTTSSNPGLISGHAKLVQGVVDQAIGSVTGSTGWTEAGDQAKAQGVNELKEYQAQNPASSAAGDSSSSAASRVEAKIGQAVGCEGLVNDANGNAGTGAGSASTSDIVSSEKDGRGSAPGGAVDGTSSLGMGTGGAEMGTGEIANEPGKRLV